MPVEIRELHIKVNVNQSSSSASDTAVGEQASGGSASANGTADLVAEAVEQVLEILRQQKER